MKIDAKGIYYRDLNRTIREAVKGGEKDFNLLNVNGQRYIGDGLEGPISIEIHGTPGQGLAAFMKGPTIRVIGNGQDGIGNTMDDGKVIVHGMAGDVVGYGMRGGKIFILGDCGYRVGIHMKAYQDKIPIIVIGGKAGDFLGEYMAGGIIVLLGIPGIDRPERPICGNYLGTGMHGGMIYIRGRIESYMLGKGLHMEEIDEKDRAFLKPCLAEYTKDLSIDGNGLLDAPFFKIAPASHRPYGSMYAY